MTDLFRGEPGRLDAVVARVAGLPRTEVQRAIAGGRVLVDGVAREKSFRLAGGERIEVDLERASALEPEPGELNVRYEDEHLLVISKPAGLVVHPTARRRTGTLVNLLLATGIPLSSGSEPDRPGIVHRLDAGTSGLLAVAKDDPTHAALRELFSRHDVERRYLALVRGTVREDAFAVEASLGRHGARTVLDPEGVDAFTSFLVRERHSASTLLDAAPRTGRTHQIRVHLASVGHPVLGDRTYGGGGDAATRLGLVRPFLHAWRLSFVHPVTGQTVEVEEEPPADLLDALDRARQA